VLDEIQCGSANDLLERLAPRSISPLTGDKQWIYRGQGDATWQLVPSAFRPDARFPSKFGSLTVDEYVRRTTPFATVLRKLSPSTPESYPFEAAQKGLEAETLTRFFNGVDAAGLSMPEDSQLLRERLMPDYGGKLEGIDDSPTWLAKWPPLELRSILALAQHHGLPTRLLDWTQDCRVAAFFAARDSLKSSTQAMAVWALDWQQLKVANLSARACPIAC